MRNSESDSGASQNMKENQSHRILADDAVISVIPIRRDDQVVHQIANIRLSPLLEQKVLRGWIVFLRKFTMKLRISLGS